MESLLPVINLMFLAKNEISLSCLFETTKKLFGNLNSYVLILVKFMDKNLLALFIIDSVKGTFGKRG